MNDVNLAPGNNNQPIKDVKGESTQTLGGGTLAGMLSSHILLDRRSVYRSPLVLLCYAP